jgi:hypothetical protein
VDGHGVPRMRGGPPSGSDGLVAPEPIDLAGAAEHLRSWLDDLAPVDADGMAAWRRAHAGPLIAAALALEELAAGTAAAPTEVGP